MPLYDFKCLDCDKEFEELSKIAERKNVRCECGGSTKQLLSSPRGYMFPTGWWEHLSKDGENVRGKEHLRSLCKRHECYAPGILD